MADYGLGFEVDNISSMFGATVGNVRNGSHPSNFNYAHLGVIAKFEGKDLGLWQKYVPMRDKTMTGYFLDPYWKDYDHSDSGLVKAIMKIGAPEALRSFGHEPLVLENPYVSTLALKVMQGETGFFAGRAPPISLTHPFSVELDENGRDRLYNEINRALVRKFELKSYQAAQLARWAPRDEAQRNLRINQVYDAFDTQLEEI